MPEGLLAIRQPPFVALLLPNEALDHVALRRVDPKTRFHTGTCARFTSPAIQHAQAVGNKQLSEKATDMMPVAFNLHS